MEHNRLSARSTGLPAGHVILKVGIEPLVTRVKLRCESNDDNVQVKMRKSEGFFQPLDKKLPYRSAVPESSMHSSPDQSSGVEAPRSSRRSPHPG